MDYLFIYLFIYLPEGGGKNGVEDEGYTMSKMSPLLLLKPGALSDRWHSLCSMTDQYRKSYLWRSHRSE